MCWLQVTEILIWEELDSLSGTTTSSGFFFSTGECGENALGKNACIKKSLSFQKLQLPEGSNLLSVDLITRSRPSSFHEIELSPVPEVAVSPQEESVDTEESSRSMSPSSSRVRHNLFLFIQMKELSLVYLFAEMMHLVWVTMKATMVKIIMRTIMKYVGDERFEDDILKFTDRKICQTLFCKRSIL